MSQEEKEDSDRSFKRYLLKKNLDILKDKRGFHTALITLMVPPTRKISDAIGYLKNEISESSNIKSKTNKKNVMDSISQLISKLRLFKEVPENGLILFSGQIPIDGKPGTEQSEIHILEPPEPITTFKYYCSSEFLLEPLYDMVSEKGAYGIINIENKEAAIGWVRGAQMEVVKTFTSGIHSKHHAGGQSQRRLERLIEEGAQYFYKRVGEYANKIFLELEDLRGIFISGGGMTKEKFLKKGILDYRISDKFVDFVDCSYSGEEGIRETVIKIQDKIADMRYIQEAKIFTHFMESISSDDGLTTYGEKSVRNALEMGAVRELLLSEDINDLRITITCPQCQYETSQTIQPAQERDAAEKVRNLQCPKCQGTRLEITENTLLVENLGEIARSQGTKIEMLSSQTEGGSSLTMTFGGIAAILRFRVDG